MVAPNDILGQRNEIKNNLAADDMAGAIKLLIDFAREHHVDSEDEVVLLSRDFYELKGEIRMELITYADAKLQKRKIAKRILDTLRYIMEERTRLKAAA